ncbi:MAG: NADH-quinone oxidoreductase subunit M [Planctomycetota bacterium]
MSDLYLVELTFLPLVAAVVVAFLPRFKVELMRQVAIGASLLIFAFSAPLASYNGTGLEHVCKKGWIESLGISLHMGVDGISVLLILLTTLTTPVVLLSSLSHIKERIKEFLVLALAMETGMIGVFATLDLVLFYVFWEVTLIPLYFIVGIWGGPRRLYAAFKFFVYTMAGSLPMLVAILYLVVGVGDGLGQPTADLTVLLKRSLTATEQTWLFLAFALAFAIKVPMFPFHTWLPDAHVEAPTGGSVVLAGVLLKMGTYGFVRFVIPMFPDAARQFQPLMLTLAVIGIVYGAFLAWAQTDIKKLIAYSSISHLGFVMLGLFAFTGRGLAGGVLQMVNHGLSTGALFLLAGMIYDRRHVREMHCFGGIARRMPVFAFFLGFVTLSSIGLPGLNGFVGEFLILLGTFEVARWYAIIGALGVLLGAIYMLGMVKRVLFGPITHKENESLTDLNRREVACLVPLCVFIVVIGIFPGPFLKIMEPNIKKVSDKVAAVTVVEKTPRLAALTEDLPGAERLAEGGSPR